MLRGRPNSLCNSTTGRPTQERVQPESSTARPHRSRTRFIALIYVRRTWCVKPAVALIFVGDNLYSLRLPFVSWTHRIPILDRFRRTKTLLRFESRLHC